MKIFPSKQKLFYFCALMCLLFTAILIRGEYFFTDRIWPDEAFFSWIANKIHANPSFIFSELARERHLPFFPALISLGNYFFADVLGHRMVIFSLNIFSIVLIYYMGCAISGSFVGILAALFLTLNAVHILCNNYVLADIPLMICYMVLMLQLLNRKLTKNYIEDVKVGLIVIATILLKWSGLIMVPLICIYYLYSFRELTFLKRLKKLSVPGIMLCIFLMIMFAAKIKPDTNALGGNYFIHPYFYYFQNWYKLLTIPTYALLLFFIGLFSSYQLGQKKAALLLSFLFVPLILTSFAAEKTIRYMLPVLPSILLIISLGINKVLQYFPNKKIRSILMILIFFGIFSREFYIIRTAYDFQISSINNSYSGFKKASEAVKVLAKENSLIFTDSGRALRLYTNLNFSEHGGNISFIPEKEDQLKKIIQENPDRNIILVIDIWQYTQPDWIFPINAEKMDNLIQMGFEIRKAVFIVFPDESKMIVPGAWVLEKKEVK